MNVGFIGLGTMGGTMARNLLQKGHQLVVADVNPDAVAMLTAEGAREAAIPLEVAAASEIVITMLPDAPDVERVALGGGGIAAGVRKGSIYIDMSTIDPETTRRIGAAIAIAGASMIDCPVGKTADAAVAGTLTLMAGGAPEIVARCRPVLDCMGTDFFYCGGLGSGQTMKLINNLLATAVSEASIEALVSGTKAGLTLDTMLSVLRTTMAWNNALAISLPKRPLAGDFAPGFMMKLAHKDCRLALAMEEGLGVAVPVGRAAFASVEEALRRGLQDHDVGALLKLREDSAGVEVRLATP